MPSTSPPRTTGSSIASGIRSTILRSSARKRLIFACPSAMNVLWQAICAPNAQMPPKKMGIMRLTMAISSASCVNMRASKPGRSTASKNPPKQTSSITRSRRPKALRTRA